MERLSDCTEVTFTPGGALAPRIIPDKEHDRAKYLGGSDAAAVMGVSRYRTPLQVFQSKRGIAPELDAADALWFRRRKRWEEVVFQMMREELDAEIIATNTRYGDPEHAFMCAEIDAEVRDGDEVVNVEVKSVDPLAFKSARVGWGEPGTDDVPLDVEAQVQHGLGVTGRRRTIVAAMVGLDRMVFYPVRRNDRVIATMRDTLRAFWYDYVLANVPPEARTLDDLDLLFPTHDEGIPAIRAEGDLAAKALRLRACKAEMDARELEADALEFDIKRAMGRAEALFVGDDKVVTWRDKAWSRLDVEAMKAKDPKAYRAFLLKGTRREMRTLKGR